eukprot:8479137-Pyramimonas_sp.AAC.1
MSLYTRRTAQVVADCTSRACKLGRGARRGDPLSPAFLNAVLERPMVRRNTRGDSAGSAPAQIKSF